MALELIPVCYDSKGIFNRENPHNIDNAYCDICNDEIYDYYDYYECKNCDFTVCSTCNAVIYNKYITLYHD